MKDNRSVLEVVPRCFTNSTNVLQDKKFTAKQLSDVRLCSRMLISSWCCALSLAHSHDTILALMDRNPRTVPKQIRGKINCCSCYFGLGTLLLVSELLGYITKRLERSLESVCIFIRTIHRIAWSMRVSSLLLKESLYLEMFFRLTWLSFRRVTGRTVW